MKQLRLSLIIFLFTIIGTARLAAQDWYPATQNNTYIYLRADKPVVKLIWVDSAKSSQGTTRYFFNRTVENCGAGGDKAIQVAMATGQMPNRWMVRNQPQFLGYEMEVRNDSLYFLKDTSFLILPKQPVGQSWPYQAGGQVTAKVESAYTMSVLGHTDSVKRITSTSGDTMILSKHYGIVTFRKAGNGYKLIGIQGQINAGNTFSANSFIELNVGDKLEYSHAENSYMGKYNRKEQVIITDKKALPNGFQYKAKGFVINEKTYSDFKTQYTYLADSKLFNLKQSYLEYVTDSSYYMNFGEMSYSNEFNAYQTWIAYGAGSFYKSFTTVSDTLFSFDDPMYDGGESKIAFAQGMGKTYDHFDGMSGTETYQLIAFKSDSITYGTFTDLSKLEYTAIQPQNGISIQAEVSPNPSSGLVKLKAQGLQGNYQVRVYDLQGRQVWAAPALESMNGHIETTLDLNSLANGTYLLRMQSPGSLYTTRLVLLR